MTEHECQWCGAEIVDDPEYVNPRLGFEWCSPKCMRGFALTGFEQSVGRWSHENFGNQPQSYPLLGAIEEVGELADLHVHRGTKVGTVAYLASILGQLSHSVLKQAQGIREDEAGVGPDADHHLSRKLGRVATDVNSNKQLGTELPLEGDDMETLDAVGDTVTYLADYCARGDEGTLGEAVELAWDDTVSNREWDADVQVGASD